jgi:hypothetical protein
MPTTNVQTPLYVSAYLADVEAFAAEVRAVEASAMKTGWCQSPGESAIYSSARAIDAVLDLAQSARNSSLENALEVCETFLRSLSGRPGAATTGELERFCAELHTAVAS